MTSAFGAFALPTPYSSDYSKLECRPTRFVTRYAGSRLVDEPSSMESQQQHRIPRSWFVGLQLLLELETLTRRPDSDICRAAHAKCKYSTRWYSLRADFDVGSNKPLKFNCLSANVA